MAAKFIMSEDPTVKKVHLELDSSFCGKLLCEQVSSDRRSIVWCVSTDICGFLLPFPGLRFFWFHLFSQVPVSYSFIPLFPFAQHGIAFNLYGDGELYEEQKDSEDLVYYRHIGLDIATPHRNDYFAYAGTDLFLIKVVLEEKSTDGISDCLAAVDYRLPSFRYDRIGRNINTEWLKVVVPPSHVFGITGLYCCPVPHTFNPSPTIARQRSWTRVRNVPKYIPFPVNVAIEWQWLDLQRHKKMTSITIQMDTLYKMRQMVYQCPKVFRNAEERLKQVGRDIFQTYSSPLFGFAYKGAKVVTPELDAALLDPQSLFIPLKFSNPEKKKEDIPKVCGDQPLSTYGSTSAYLGKCCHVYKGEIYLLRSFDHLVFTHHLLTILVIWLLFVSSDHVSSIRYCTVPVGSSLLPEKGNIFLFL